MPISSRSPDSGNHLTLDNTHTQQPFYQKIFCSTRTSGWLAYAHDKTLDLIVMSAILHCHWPQTIDVQLALLMLTVANPVVDVDPVDPDVVDPFDDTNHRQIPDKNIKT